jgi:hypothetical protein
MNREERNEILDDEYLIVRNSGEIPEITLHSALHFLTEDPEGPGIELADEELSVLKSAAAERYQEIVLRDIQLKNYHKTLYRGIRRSIYNLERYQQFCMRQDLDWHDFQQIVGEQLLRFLDEGISAAGTDIPKQFLNCTYSQLVDFSNECGVAKGQLPKNIEHYCTAEADI